MYNDALLMQHASANNNTRIGESSLHTLIIPNTQLKCMSKTAD